MISSSNANINTSTSTSFDAGPLAKVVQPFIDQVDLVTDPLAPSPKRQRQRPQSARQGTDGQHAGVAVSVDLGAEGRLIRGRGREDELVDDPADQERKGQGKSHEERSGEDETAGREADVGIEPAVADDGSQRGGRARGRVPQDEAAEHFDIENAEGPVLDEVDHVSVRGDAEVGMQWDNDVEFDEEREERGEKDGERRISVQHAEGTSNIRGGSPKEGGDGGLSDEREHDA